MAEVSGAGLNEDTTEVLVHSLAIYGGIFLCGLPIYCLLRKKFPRVYAVRQWVDGIRSPLADDQFGFISWMWNVYSFSTEQLCKANGLDALCFLRLLNMGFRLAGVGVFNSIWLLPVYHTAKRGADSEAEDAVDDVSINNLEDGSPRFAATVIASYIFFGYTFYTILKDFRWFILQRHLWLERLNVRNYTILVRNIPEDLRSDSLLLEHFRNLYGRDKVLEAQVCLHITELDGLVAERKVCVANLEHALAELAINGERPKHYVVSQLLENMIAGAGNAAHSFSKRGKNTKSRDKSEVDSIDFYTKELNVLNSAIGDKIDEVKQKQRPTLAFKRSTGFLTTSINTESGSNAEESNRLLSSAAASPNYGDISDEEAMRPDKAMSPFSKLKETLDPELVTGAVKDVVSETTSTAFNAGNALKTKAIKKAEKRARQAKGAVEAGKGAASSILRTQEDGTPDHTGFVTFTSLAAVHGAIQMSQHPEPFVLDTFLCPDEPEHIMWNNVGKDSGTMQTGLVVSAVMSVALCLLWTIPVAAIVNLTDPDYLRDKYPNVDAALEKPAPKLFLNLISPLLLLIFNSGILPVLLRLISQFEFPASSSVLEASTFWKMATFHIIQTFFVTLVSGSMLEEIATIAESPKEFINLLGEVIPKKSGYFMQLLIISICTGSLIELFRVVPLVYALGRRFVGWRLTEKERNQRVGVLKPLGVVDQFYYSRQQARMLLYFMILFVFTSISPLVNWFSLFFFLLLGSFYRHQFAFNYPGSPDSGGEIWLQFIHVTLASIMIAQLSIVGYLSIKKATIALIMMIPLIVGSSLFVIYLHQRHFRIGKFLPARRGLRKDLDNMEEGVDFSQFKNVYKSPSLMARFLDADWECEVGHKGGFGIAGKEEDAGAGHEANDEAETEGELGKVALEVDNGDSNK